jgi:hypothetical protein
MKRASISRLILVVFLCLFISSTAYSVTSHYHGYAVLYDTDTQGRPCAIVSDGNGQYIDRDPNETGATNLRGDKIEVSYDTTTSLPTYFRCFMGKPELPWRSDRRVLFNFNFGSTQWALGKDYASNRTLADMLKFNYFDQITGNRISSPTPRIFNDNSVHISIARCGYEDPKDSLALFLVDQSDEALDKNAITQTNLKKLDKKAPSYWTSLQGVSTEQDTHDNIAFLLYYQVSDPGQLIFTPIGYENGIPITWLVEPDNRVVNLEVRRLSKPGRYDRQVLRTINSLPFSLVVSKYPIINDTQTPKSAPPRFDMPTTLWGEIKGE